MMIIINRDDHQSREREREKKIRAWNVDDNDDILSRKTRKTFYNNKHTNMHTYTQTHTHTRVVGDMIDQAIHHISTTI